MASGRVVFRPRSVIVLRLGNSVAIAHHGEMSVKLLTPRITGYHALAHSILRPDKNIRSFVNRYVDSPSDILQLAGQVKNNLVLFLSFTGQMGLRVLTDLGPDQLVLYDLLRFNQKEWHDLLRYDIETFTRLENFLNIDASQKANFSQETRALLHILRPRRLSNKESVHVECDAGNKEASKPGAHAFASFIIRLHGEFCGDSKPSSDLDTKMRAYSSMIQCIRNNETPTALCEEIPFYNEISLINDFVLSCGDPNYFDFNLLKIDCRTPNEVLVRQFVVERIRSWKQHAQADGAL